MANPRGEICIEAPDIGLNSSLTALPMEHPLRATLRTIQEMLKLKALPAFHLRITSSIPVAAGLGSGAAVSVAIARAVSEFLGQPLPDDQVSAVAFRIDQIYHGTPSGIDNTVITYAKPVWYVRGSPFERLSNAVPFTLLIAHSGIHSPTGAVVADLRKRWIENPSSYNPRFTRIGAISHEARTLIEIGRPEELGPLMTSNHELLQGIDVSCPELDHLVDTAQSAGALGAKMSGGGRGGNMIALVRPDRAEAITAALTRAGAVQVITTQVD